MWRWCRGQGDERREVRAERIEELLQWWQQREKVRSRVRAVGLERGKEGAIQDLVTDLMLRENRKRERENLKVTSIVMTLTWKIEVLQMEIWAEREHSRFSSDLLLSVCLRTSPCHAPFCYSFWLLWKVAQINFVIKWRPSALLRSETKWELRRQGPCWVSP